MRVSRCFALAAWLAHLSACSTASRPVDAGSISKDAASGPQPVGAPCDLALAAPCLPPGDACLAVACDPATLVCTESPLSDAGPRCNGGAAACATSSDCDVGLVCGFAIGAGCGAAGVCLNAPVLCQSDAAACPTGGTTCGCAGPVAVVVPGFAAGPSASGATGAGLCAPDAAQAPVEAGSSGADAGP